MHTRTHTNKGIYKINACIQQYIFLLCTYLTKNYLNNIVFNFILTIAKVSLIYQKQFKKNKKYKN